MCAVRHPGHLLPALVLAAGAAVGVPATALADEPDQPDQPRKDIAENFLDGLRTGLADLGNKVRAEAGLTSRTLPESASGELVTVPVDGLRGGVDRSGAQVRHVRVQVEDGLPVDGEAFAEYVMRTLNDERGWGHDGSVSFVAVEEGQHFSVALATPGVVDELCVPLRTAGQYSCGRNGFAALNADRWAYGAEPFLDGGGSLPQYRQYLVNHEVGHLLGKQHTPCPEAGGPAPTMLQQTMRLEGCTPNGWPAHDPA